MQKTGMNWDNLKTVTYAPKCKAPAVFIHAIEDTLVTMNHTEENYTVYGGEKDVIYCDGDHNSERPEDVQQAVLNFFKKYLLA